MPNGAGRWRDPYRERIPRQPITGELGDRTGDPTRSAFRATLTGMPPAPPPLSLRLGSDGLNELDEIARRRGISRAEAARQAIAETAERERRRGGLAAEARRLMADEAYVKEALEVTELMEELRGPR
jgi:predicted transcriptional regulator